MKKLLSLVLALALCLSLAVPALAANQPGDTTVTDEQGNIYTLSSPILYTISKEQIEKLSFTKDYVSYTVLGESHDPQESILHSVTKAYAVPDGTTITVPNDTTKTTQNGSVMTTETTGFRLEPQVVELSKSGEEYAVTYEEYFPSYPYVLDTKNQDFENAFWVMECYKTHSVESEDTNGGGAEGGSSDYIGTIAFFVPTSPDLQNGFPGASSSANKPAAPTTPATPAITSKPTFTDVAADSPYADAISWAVAQGITNGKTETTFGTKDTCTISHILTFLWRANGKPGAKSGEAERDSVLRWANGQGMVVTLDMFPSPCTRARAVNFMWMAAGKPAEKESTSFTDVYPDDFTKGIAWAVEKGITQGTSATTFSPDRICTRGQIVTFLYRAFSK